MKIGKMRSPVQFQRRTLNQDPATGSLTPVWTTYEAAFADLDGTQGKETLEGTNKLNAEVTHRVWVRAHDRFEPRPQDRILHKSRVLEIIFVVNIQEKDRYYLIGAYEDYNQ